jgi:N-glycosylase/DNA lyase
MKLLLQKIQHLSLSSALEIEKTDPQFLSLKKLYSKIKNKKMFLPLILANCTV